VDEQDEKLAGMVAEADQLKASYAVMVRHMVKRCREDYAVGDVMAWPVITETISRTVNELDYDEDQKIQLVINMLSYAVVALAEEGRRD